MKKLKQNQGITLVSLIVTIIVMIILAGIALFFATGDQGVILRAEEAKQKQSQVEEQEKVELAVTSAVTEGKGTLTKDAIEDAIKNEFDDSATVIENDSEYEIKINETIYKVSKAGKVELSDSVQEDATGGSGDDEKIMGDVNFDGVLDQKDIEKMEEFMNMISEPTEDELEVGDFDGSGYIDASDFTVLINMINSVQ